MCVYNARAAGGVRRALVATYIPPQPHVFALRVTASPLQQSRLELSAVQAAVFSLVSIKISNFNNADALTFVRYVPICYNSS